MSAAPSAESPAGGSDADPREAGTHFRVRVTVDGRELPLKPFIQDMLGGAAVGLVSGLKDGRNPGELSIEVRRL